eukprot:m51a1_g11556 hypothetical protein (635) ;mRNA; r:16457-18361
MVVTAANKRGARTLCDAIRRLAGEQQQHQPQSHDQQQLRALQERVQLVAKLLESTNDPSGVAAILRSLPNVGNSPSATVTATAAAAPGQQQPVEPSTIQQALGSYRASLAGLTSCMTAITQLNMDAFSKLSIPDSHLKEYRDKMGEAKSAVEDWSLGFLRKITDASGRFDAVLSDVERELGAAKDAATALKDAATAAEAQQLDYVATRHFVGLCNGQRYVVPTASGAAMSSDSSAAGSVGNHQYHWVVEMAGPKAYWLRSAQGLYLRNVGSQLQLARPQGTGAAPQPDKKDLSWSWSLSRLHCDGNLFSVQSAVTGSAAVFLDGHGSGPCLSAQQPGVALERDTRLQWTMWDMGELPDQGQVATLTQSLLSAKNNIAAMKDVVDGILSSLQSSLDKLPGLVAQLEHIVDLIVDDQHEDAKRIAQLRSELADLRDRVDSLIAQIAILSTVVGGSAVLGIVMTYAAGPFGALSWFALAPVIAFAGYTIAMDGIELHNLYGKIEAEEEQKGKLEHDVDVLVGQQTQYAALVAKAKDAETSMRSVADLWGKLEVDVSLAISDITAALSANDSSAFKDALDDVAGAQQAWSYSVQIQGMLHWDPKVSTASFTPGMTADQVRTAMASSALVSLEKYILNH